LFEPLWVPAKKRPKRGRRRGRFPHVIPIPSSI
jgi:hypothetical protein